MNNESRTPSPLISVIPLIALVGMVSLVVIMFGSDALGGGSQIALLFGSAICVALSMSIYHRPWLDFEEGIKQTLGSTSVSIVILLLIGMLSGAWMISGVVPTMIYYGVQIMSPQFFLVCTCVICAAVSVMTGSSWTTIATIGVALLGIGEALAIPVGWTAGAIISGAYFGDKISPLSDTTVLAATASDTELFTHIRYMMLTTTPSFLVAVAVFFIAGLVYGGSSDVQVSAYTEGLSRGFTITLWSLLIPLFMGVLIVKKVPSLITLFASALLAGIFSLFVQTDVLIGLSGDANPDSLSALKGMMISFFTSTSVDTGNDQLNSLVSTGGMAGMLNTIWLILCAMCFGGCMVASGMIHSLMSALLRGVQSTVGLVSSTALTGVLMNVVTSDQYISIIMTANMYRDAYKRSGHESRLLSRTTEDAATVTSVLVPWNTCGMTQATVLGVATMTYLPYCIFNYVSPLMSVLVAAMGWRIKKQNNNENQ